MGHGLKLALLFAWITFIYVTGILLFTKGFLLNRLEIPTKSSLNGSAAGIDSSEAHGGQARNWEFKRAVLILIDALRYDFTLYNESLPENETKPYQNKLKVIHDELNANPQHARLYRLLADPPTTTMQRLKGLTTGSLPTFIDMSKNFASSAITEDNLLHHLKENNKNMVFMGDSTWLDLFPDKFLRSSGFPPFNTKDLYSTDNGIIKQLVPEMLKDDWDVLIAHFVGVDNCGHSFGPDTDEMRKKLLQMNDMLRSVINALDDQSVLFVFGDHGMTSTGDHGGDSGNEVSSALFMYSKQPVFVSEQNVLSQRLFQIDMVPTLSLLLGVPIPFSNLGSIIPDLFQRVHLNSSFDAVLSSPVQQVLQHVEALHLNVQQVREYIIEYSKLAEDLPQHKLDKLKVSVDDAEESYKEILEQLQSHTDMSSEEKDHFNTQIMSTLLQVKRNYTLYLSEVKSICQQAWAKFDNTFISLGLVVIGFGIIFSIHLITSLTKELHLLPVDMTTVMVSLKPLLFGGGCGFLAGLSYSLYFQDFSTPVIGFFCAFTSIVFYAFSARGRLLQLSITGISNLDIFVWFLWIAYCVSMFSNSFVLYEDHAALYFTQTLLICSSVTLLWKHSRLEHCRKTSIPRKGRKDTGPKLTILAVITSRRFLLALFFLLVGVLLRLSASFFTCREMQTGCENPIFLHRLATLVGQNDASYNYRYWFSVMSIVSCPFLLWIVMHYLGNLNGLGLPVLCVKYALPFASICVCLHWAMQIVPQLKSVELNQLKTVQQVVLPDIAYALCLFTIIILVWRPLYVYAVLPRERNRFSNLLSTYSDLNYMDKNTIPKLFREVQVSWNKSKGEENANGKDESSASPTVYGLATVYSSALKVLNVSVVIVLCLILGDGFSPGMFLSCAQAYLALEAYTSIFNNSQENITGPAVFLVILWCFMCSQNFFTTGHQATVPSIRFDAAFVGRPGDMENNLIPAFLVLMNTYASQVMFAVSLPLMLFWPWIPARLLSYKSNTSNVVDKGQFMFWENPWALRCHLFKLLATYQAVLALKVLAVAGCAALHRRHLMVWKIFAPHFLFEAVGFLVSSFFLLVVFLFVLRIDVCLQSFISKLEECCKSER